MRRYLVPSIRYYHNNTLKLSFTIITIKHFRKFD